MSDFKITVDGIASLTQQFADLRQTQPQKLARVVLGSALRVIGDEMKRLLDPKVQEAGRRVGHRVTISRGVITRAKVGFNVGKRGKENWRRKRSGPGGIGIGGQNVHWRIMGTGERYRGGRRRKRVTKATASQYTGQMPAMQPDLAANAFNAVKGQLPNIMARAGRRYAEAMAKRSRQFAARLKQSKTGAK